MCVVNHMLAISHLRRGIVCVRWAVCDGAYGCDKSGTARCSVCEVGCVDVWSRCVICFAWPDVACVGRAMCVVWHMHLISHARCGKACMEWAVCVCGVCTRSVMRGVVWCV